jgi:hypothetical protein
MSAKLATQEAEIRRIVVQTLLQPNSSQDLISKISNAEQGWERSSSDRAPT